MKYTIVNQDEIPDDLAPGKYCCHLEKGATWQEFRVRADLSHPHVPGDCLVQMIKEEQKTEPPASV